VLRSNPALALAMVLMGLWSALEMGDSGRVHWSFLIGWSAVAAAMLWRRWVPGLHLAAIILSIWIVTIGYFLFNGHGHSVVVEVGIFIGAAGLAGPVVFGRWRIWGQAAVAYGMAIAFAGLFALQFIETVQLDRLILLAIVTLALVVGGIWIGLKTSNGALLWLGYAGFSIEVLALYFKTVGTLLGSSLFFLSAGVIVILLAIAAYRLHSRVHPGLEAAP
jgi:uncharacterized membrane protein